MPVERSKTEGATLKSIDSKFQTPCQGAKGSGDTASVTALYTALTVLLKIPKGAVHCCITLKAEKKEAVTFIQYICALSALADSASCL